MNAYVLGKERDLVWREQRVVVETDTYEFHSDARTWARDIGKTNELQLARWLVLRFTWFDVTERPVWVLAKIKGARIGAPTRTAKRPPLPGRASRSLSRVGISVSAS